MNIYIDRKKYDFKNTFTFNEFIQYVQEKCTLIFNFDNISIIEKFKKIYEFLSNEHGNISKNKFPKVIYDNFQLTDRQQESRKSLLQRGFDEIFIENFLLEKGKKRSNILRSKYKQIENKKYVYGNYIIENDKEPLCNICGSELIFRKKKNGVFEFVTCSNKDCEINKFNNHNRYLAITTKEQRPIDRTTKTLCVEYWINKGHSEQEAKEIISHMQTQYSSQVKNRKKINRTFYEEKYGKEKADAILRQRSQLCVEYWIEKGFNEEEAKEKISQLQKKYGDIGAKKFTRKYSCKCIEYWIEKGYNEEEAKEKISSHQSTFSLEKCIKKYGVEKGTKKWEERQKKWQTTLHKNHNLHVGFSQISQELFDILNKQMENNDYIFYGSKNQEYSINENNKNYIYDFCDLDKRKIIEFNGDIYHGNPKFYSETDTPNPFNRQKTCKEIWEYDEIKKNIAVKHNFDFLTIWENEYREQKEETIKKCLNFLNNEEII